VARRAVAVRRAAGSGSTVLRISTYMMCDAMRFNLIQEDSTHVATQKNPSTPYPTLASLGLSLMHSVYCSTASRQGSEFSTEVCSLHPTIRALPLHYA